MSNIRSLIKQRIEEQGDSIPKIARALGLNHQTLYNYLAGRTEMKAVNLEKLFGYLKIELG